MIDNLRVLDAPTRLLNLALARWDGSECGFVKIENSPIRAIANSVRLDLNSATQRFFKHRPQHFRFLGKITGRFGRVTVRPEQRCPARAKRSIENHLDRALGEVMIEGVDCRSFTQKVLRIFAGAINTVDEPDFRVAGGESP